MYWTSGGRLREGVSPSQDGELFRISGVLKPGFGCVIKLKSTSILAPNMYDCSIQGVGGRTVSVDTKGGGGGGGCGGRGHPPPMLRTFSKFWYKTQVFRAKMLKFT